jgi:hypothetical protein
MAQRSRLFIPIYLKSHPHTCIVSTVPVAERPYPANEFLSWQRVHQKSRRMFSSAFLLFGRETRDREPKESLAILAFALTHNTQEIQATSWLFPDYHNLDRAQLPVGVRFNQFVAQPPCGYWWACGDNLRLCIKRICND